MTDQAHIDAQFQGQLTQLREDPGSVATSVLLEAMTAAIAVSIVIGIEVQTARKRGDGRACTPVLSQAAEIVRLAGAELDLRIPPRRAP